MTSIQIMIGQLPMLTKGPFALYYGGRSNMILFQISKNQKNLEMYFLTSGSEIEESLSSLPAGIMFLHFLEVHARMDNDLPENT